MACMNDEVKYTAGVPEDVKALRAKLIAMLQSKSGGGATPYAGRLTAPPDPMQLAANNTIMKMMGYAGYTFPGQEGDKPPYKIIPPDDLPTTNGTASIFKTSGPSGMTQGGMRQNTGGWNNSNSGLNIGGGIGGNTGGGNAAGGGIDPYSPQGRLLAAMLNQRR